MDLAIEIIKTKNCNCCMLSKIKIKDFEEYFSLSLDYWTLEDYKRQWKEGLERIKSHTASCLITSIQDPKQAPFLDWWALYKRDSKIYIQNYTYFAEIYESIIGNQVFTIDTCYNYIPRRTIKPSDPKYKISEWSVDIWW